MGRVWGDPRAAQAGTSGLLVPSGPGQEGPVEYPILSLAEDFGTKGKRVLRKFGSLSFMCNRYKHACISYAIYNRMVQLDHPEDGRTGKRMKTKSCCATKQLGWDQWGKTKA